MIRLFAFGTLKRGFPLHETLCDAPCLGVCRTVERYPMLIAGPWFAPMMLDQPGAGHHVQGELYELDESRLPRIDAVESVGRPGNFRIEIDVESRDAGLRTAAFVYVKSPDLATPVHSPLLSEYRDRRFIPPWLRP